jgi:hypothetical protein
MSVGSGLTQLLDVLVRAPFFPYDAAREAWRNVLPNSLLVGLLLLSTLLSTAATVMVNQGSADLLLERSVWTAAPSRPGCAVSGRQFTLVLVSKPELDRAGGAAPWVVSAVITGA